jgi:hypothetical protein
LNRASPAENGQFLSGRGIKVANSAPTRLAELFKYPCFCRGGCQIIRE